jgi:capsular exopolysaccharide synthesis family protein
MAVNEQTQSLIPGLGEGFDLKNGLKLLWAGKATIVALTLVGAGLGFLVTYMQTPLYRAQALVQIDPPTQNLMALSNPYPATALHWFDQRAYYKTQFRVIRSKAIGDKALKKLDLYDKPPFRNAADPGALLVSHVQVIPLPDTRLASIATTHHDPETAALWTNAVAEAYVDQNIETKIETTRTIYSWLQERLNAAQDAVRESEERLHEYSEGQDLFIPDGGPTIVSGTLQKLNDAHTEAKTRRIELESTLSQIRALRQQKRSLESVPQVSKDPLVQSLNMQRAQLEVEVIQLKNKYKEGHPEIKKRRTQMTQIQQAINTQAEKIVTGLETDYNQVRRREQELLASVNSQKRESIEQSRKAVQLDMLQGEAVSNKNLYEAILQKIKETDVASSLWNNNVSIVERALVPAAPFRPEPTRNLALAFVGGFAFGCGLVFLRSYLDNTIREQEEIESYLHTDCLAIIPKHGEVSDGAVTESYRSLRTSLLFSREREKGNVVLITSAIPQEGKSTTALNVAKALAGSGESTLLIDFDLRRGNLHKRLKINPRPGLADYTVRDLPLLQSIVQKSRLSNLFAIAPGRLPTNPPAFIGSPAVKRLLEEARARYTWVLLDAPPLVGVTDPLLLAKLVDMVLMVVRYNVVDRKLARRCVNLLRKSNTRLIGAVLNAVDSRNSSYYGYYYNYYHKNNKQAATVTPLRQVRRARCARIRNLRAFCPPSRKASTSGTGSGSYGPEKRLFLP